MLELFQEVKIPAKEIVEAKDPNNNGVATLIGVSVVRLSMLQVCILMFLTSWLRNG